MNLTGWCQTPKAALAIILWKSEIVSIKNLKSDNQAISYSLKLIYPEQDQPGFNRQFKMPPFLTNMKNLILAFFLTITVFAANAGNDVSRFNSEASDIARRMANQIELNELEYIQVRNYTIAKLEAVATIREMYANNQEQMETKIQETESDYTFRIRNLLNSKQFENYATLSNSFKTQVTLIANIKE